MKEKAEISHIHIRRAGHGFIVNTGKSHLNHEIQPEFAFSTITEVLRFVHSQFSEADEENVNLWCGHPI